MQFQFSNDVAKLQPSAIREILKFTSMPGVISFAAGNPAPEAFPTELIADLSSKLLREHPVMAMQYSITEGYPELREQLKQWMTEKHCFSPETDDLIITSGAQQANELSCKVLLNPGDTLICEAPSFIGSLNAFRSYGVNLVSVPLEEDGMDLAALEHTLQTEPNCKLIYIIPNFQNPTGRVTSLEKRKGIYELACKYNVAILYAGSFSKILAPGFRVGYLSAPKELVQKVVVCKQVSDVHTNIWAQIMCSEFLKNVDLQEHLEGLRKIYRHKKPEGGLFIWCTLPDDCDMPEFCKKAVSEYKIAVVPGNAFLVDESQPTTSFRLNFSTPTDEQIVTGITILGRMTKELFSE